MLLRRANWNAIAWVDDHLRPWWQQLNYVVTFGFVLAAGMFHGKGHMQMAGAAMVLYALSRQLGRYRMTTRMVPPELMFYTAWGIWCLLTGPFVSIAPAVFWYQIKTLAQMIIMLWAMTILLNRQRQLDSFCLAVLLVALLNVAAVKLGYDMQIVQGEFVQKDMYSLDEATNRVSGLTGNANSFAFLSLYGVWAIMMLWIVVKKVPKVVKTVLAIPLVGVFAFYIVQSASRKSLMTLGMLLVGWLAWVIPGKRNQLLRFLIIIAIVIVMPLVVTYIMSDTYVGVRLQREIDVGGGSLLRGFREGNIRYQFVIDGIRMWLDNPIFGVGLAQFSVNHWSGLYSHSDYIEPLACTGIVGFILYHGCAFTIMRRLFKLVRLDLPEGVKSIARGMIVGMLGNYYFLGLGAPHWSGQLCFLIVLFCGVWSFRTYREYVLGRAIVGG